MERIPSGTFVHKPTCEFAKPWRFDDSNELAPGRHTPPPSPDPRSPYLRASSLWRRHHCLKYMNLRYSSLSLCFALFATCSFAAPSDSDIADRYLDLNACMDQAMGKGWQRRYDIHMSTNRWGASEASPADLDSAPQAVRVTALRCRRETTPAPQSPPFSQ